MKSPLKLKTNIQWIGLIAGPLLAILLYSLLPHAYPNSAGEMVAFSNAGRATTALAVWMAVWWMTEAVELIRHGAPAPGRPSHDRRGIGARGGRALRPRADLPLHGRLSHCPGHAALGTSSAHGPQGAACGRRPSGGHRGVLHGRDGLLQHVGVQHGHRGHDAAHRAQHHQPGGAGGTRQRGKRRREPAGGQAETPALEGGVGDAGPGSKARPHFALCLLLGIAYAASIGGIGTIIGTPPNVFLASYIQSSLGQEISFVRWMGVGLPLVAVFLPLAWLMLTRVLYPLRGERIEGSREVTEKAYRELGVMSRGERVVLAVFLLAAVSWITRPLLVRVQIGDMNPLAGLSDPVIAMVAALVLFVVPVDVKRRIFVMNWETALKIPWGILLLFGGGLSLAAAIRVNGVGEYIGHQLAILSGIPTLLLVMAVIALVIFLTELTSNTATTATFIPILAALAPVFDLHPFMLIVPAAIAASCAFMLPVATPPNAIVFGSGHVTIQQMIRAGFWLNLAGVVLITMLAYTVMMRMLGV